MIEKDQRFNELTSLYFFSESEIYQQLNEISDKLKENYPELFENFSNIILKNPLIQSEENYKSEVYHVIINDLYSKTDKKVSKTIQDFYFINRNSNKTLIYCPMPHISFSLSCVLLTPLLYLIPYNIVIVDNTKIFSSDANYEKTEIQNMITQEVEGALTELNLIETEKTFLSICFGATVMSNFFQSQLNLYDKTIFYAPMFKNVVTTQPQPVKLGLMGRINKSILYGLMQLITNQKTIFPVIEPMKNKTLDIDLFREFFVDFEAGIDLSGMKNPHLIMSQNDKIVAAENSLSGSSYYKKEYVLENPNGNHMEYLTNQEGFLNFVKEIMDE